MPERDCHNDQDNLADGHLASIALPCNALHLHSICFLMPRIAVHRAASVLCPRTCRSSSTHIAS
jgi:hypothetical protein